MNIDKKKLIIQILALVGLGLTIDLAYIYYTANYDKYALSSFCSINEFVDCDGAAKSVYSQFLGIPLAYWGMFFYLIILFLTFVDKLKNVRFLKFLEVFKEPKAYISTLGTIAFLCSMILAGLSVFKINKICILCVVTYFVDLAIALVASEGLARNVIEGFKTTVLDFIDGAKKYTKTFIVLLLLFLSFLAYTGITLNFVPNVKNYREINKYRKIKFNPYRVKGNVLGNENGDVIVEIYSDYVCPMCYIQNIMLHQAVKEFNNIKIVHHNYPMDRECNVLLDINLHPKACFMAKVALAAKEQGNYWEMASLLYENKPKKIEEAVKLAEQLNLDKDKFVSDLTSNKIAKSLKKEIDDANDISINATPTTIINGEQVVGIKPYYKLKEVLIQHGAK